MNWIKRHAGEAEVSAADRRPARIELDHVAKRFPAPGGEFTALREASFAVEPGEFCAVVGPSGCGKSTMLGMVAGLERPSAGCVRIDGAEVRGLTSGVGFVFQQDALLPWKSALANVEMGPIYRGARKLDACNLARDWMRRVGLAGFENHYPNQLSAGMRKRVALAATLINEPRILLMDEPFASLDVHTRALMQSLLLKLWEQSRPSVLFITHDPDEAVALADRVVVMSAGPGTVKAVYDVDLPRPRAATQSLRFQSGFLDTRRRVWHTLAA